MNVKLHIYQHISEWDYGRLTASIVEFDSSMCLSLRCVKIAEKDLDLDVEPVELNAEEELAKLKMTLAKEKREKLERELASM